MKHTSLNIKDEIFKKFKEYKSKEPVNLSATINAALEKYLDEKLKKK